MKKEYLLGVTEKPSKPQLYLNFSIDIFLLRPWEVNVQIFILPVSLFIPTLLWDLLQKIAKREEKEYIDLDSESSFFFAKLFFLTIS